MTLYTIFETNLQQPQYEVREATLEALSSFISMTDVEACVQSLSKLCQIALSAATYILE